MNGHDPQIPTDGGIVFAGLMPHAPVLVEGVGRPEHRRQCRATIRAMHLLARHALLARPDAVLVVSPHSPRLPRNFGLWQTACLQGSFAPFGAEEGRFVLPLDGEFTRRLTDEAVRRDLRTWSIKHGALDHGASVPLAFLLAAGWRGPTAVIGLTDVMPEELNALGLAIAATATALDRRLAVIASGDMSHRLTRSAPCGYHKNGARFDRAFISLLHAGTTAEIPRMDTRLLENAAEDVVESVLVALAAVDAADSQPTVLSYEGPFGVGYGVAILAERPGSEPAALARSPVLSHRGDLPLVAREAVFARLGGSTAGPPFHAAGSLAASHGVFVTLRTTDGALRGCRGTVEPVHRDLVEETWQVACLAAFHDPRFPPLRAEELAGVRFSVNVLGPLEAASPDKLDPAAYGIAIRAHDGRHSLLLPAIKGIASVDAQLRVARQKAGMASDEPVEIQRFTTMMFSEPPPPDGGKEEQ